MRQGDQVQVLLLTSRGTGRWVLPKGWAEEDLTGPEVAAKEAFEEAGLLGDVRPCSLGSYHYLKEMSEDPPVHCRVEVFAMWVHQSLEDWPERPQRTRQWFSLLEAAPRVQEDGLRILLQRLAEQHG
jgi:8-oxo-dGTP pyrophosphatase MutT (NUDIX family)